MEEEKNRATSSDELISFLNEVTVEGSCPSCKHDQFKVCASDSHGAWRFEVDVMNRELAMPMYMMFCEKCGYLRAHNAIVVDEWVATQRAKTDTGTSSQPEGCNE
ncbi:hypothetical protein IRZ59_04740 [Pseudomonas guariconensis]|uniref:hypothetical protein n=1 Tax=Pseudomonas guariconensis TaxID=1288410 RepID=UPI0018ABBFBA|nr:hypothetical protein [Pseudomonas guariconensis]MBF8729744.1 hypothetical protein [Pseudomonas guariconensis]